MWCLKDSDGLETLKDVMANAPDMPVIIMSAQNTLETAVRASEIKAFEYFPKPFRPERSGACGEAGDRQAPVDAG